MTDYMKTMGAAEYLSSRGFHLTDVALRNLVHRGRIPYRKVAGRLIFIRSELDRWVSQAPGVTLESLQKRVDGTFPPTENRRTKK